MAATDLCRGRHPPNDAGHGTSWVPAPDPTGGARAGGDPHPLDDGRGPRIPGASRMAGQAPVRAHPPHRRYPVAGAVPRPSHRWSTPVGTLAPTTRPPRPDTDHSRHRPQPTPPAHGHPAPPSGHAVDVARPPWGTETRPPAPCQPGGADGTDGTSDAAIPGTNGCDASPPHGRPAHRSRCPGRGGGGWDHAQVRCCRPTGEAPQRGCVPGQFGAPGGPGDRQHRMGRDRPTPPIPVVRGGSGANDPEWWRVMGHRTRPEVGPGRRFPPSRQLPRGRSRVRAASWTTWCCSSVGASALPQADRPCLRLRRGPLGPEHRPPGPRRRVPLGWPELRCLHAAGPSNYRVWRWPRRRPGSPDVSACALTGRTGARGPAPTRREPSDQGPCGETPGARRRHGGRPGRPCGYPERPGWVIGTARPAGAPRAVRTRPPQATRRPALRPRHRPGHRRRVGSSGHP